jgi:hypothetical protein
VTSGTVSCTDITASIINDPLVAVSESVDPARLDLPTVR